MTTILGEMQQVFLRRAELIKTRIEIGKTMSKGFILPLEGYELSNVERKNVNLRLEGKRVRGECFKGVE
jgi:hypothetical protein